MVCPIRISVSLTPGAYFFCASAGAAIRSTAAIAKSSRIQGFAFIVVLPCSFLEIWSGFCRVLASGTSGCSDKDRAVLRQRQRGTRRAPILEMSILLLRDRGWTRAAWACQLRVKIEGREHDRGNVRSSGGCRDGRYGGDRAARRGFAPWRPAGRHPPLGAPMPPRLARRDAGGRRRGAVAHPLYGSGRARGQRRGNADRPWPQGADPAGGARQRCRLPCPRL